MHTHTHTHTLYAFRSGEVFAQETNSYNCGALGPLVVSVLSYDWEKLGVHRGCLHRTLAVLVQDVIVRFTNVARHYKEDEESLELGKRNLLSASLNFLIGQQVAFFSHIYSLLFFFLFFFLKKCMFSLVCTAAGSQPSCVSSSVQSWIFSYEVYQIFEK